MKKNRINRNKAQEFTPVSSLPKLNSAKFTNENRVWIHPVCDLGKACFIPNKGWRLAGWSSPPYPGSGPHAIVYELMDSEINDSYYTTSFSPGLYWGHGNADKMQFCIEIPDNLKDELGPWI